MGQSGVGRIRAIPRLAGEHVQTSARLVVVWAPKGAQKPPRPVPEAQSAIASSAQSAMLARTWGPNDAGVLQCFQIFDEVLLLPVTQTKHEH
jgi:hypothetical protein